MAGTVRTALREGEAAGRQGGAVQVEPMKSKLKAPGTKCLNLKCGKLLSSFGFKFNLRRYTKVVAMRICGGAAWGLDEVRRCKFNR